jgi:hypothetical protein
MLVLVHTYARSQADDGMSIKKLWPQVVIPDSGSIGCYNNCVMDPGGRDRSDPGKWIALVLGGFERYCTFVPS